MCNPSIAIYCPIYGIYDLWTSPSTTSSQHSNVFPTGYSSSSSVSIPTGTPINYPTLTTSQEYSAISTKSLNHNTYQSSDDAGTAWTGQTTTKYLPGSNKDDKNILISNEVLITSIACVSVIVVALIILIGYSKKQRRSQVNNEIDLGRVHTVSRHDHNVDEAEVNYVNDNFTMSVSTLNINARRNETVTAVNANYDGEDVVVVEKANYLQWTQEEVLVWLKINLRDKKMNEDVIESFLNEFEQQHITGAILQQFKMNEKLVDQLQCKFSQKNQAFGVWMIIKTAIGSLDNM